MFLISCKYFRQDPSVNHPDGFVTDRADDPKKYKLSFEKNSLNTQPGLSKNIVKAIINVYKMYESTGKLEYYSSEELNAPVHKPKKVINA